MNLDAHFGSVARGSKLNSRLLVLAGKRGERYKGERRLLSKAPNHRHHTMNIFVIALRLAGVVRAVVNPGQSLRSPSYR